MVYIYTNWRGYITTGIAAITLDLAWTVADEFSKKWCKNAYQDHYNVRYTPPTLCQAKRVAEIM
jgi:hypothetical protein